MIEKRTRVDIITDIGDGGVEVRYYDLYDDINGRKFVGSYATIIFKAENDVFIIDGEDINVLETKVYRLLSLCWEARKMLKKNIEEK